MSILILRRLFANVTCGHCGVLNICTAVKNCIKQFAYMVNMQTGLMATTPVTSTTENQLTQV